MSIFFDTINKNNHIYEFCVPLIFTLVYFMLVSYGSEELSANRERIQ